MCYIALMTTVGLRELRQNASELVRQAQAGETVTVTVAGRPAAQLSPVATPRRWRLLSDVRHQLRGTPDAEWQADRNLVDQTVDDPFSR